MTDKIKAVVVKKFRNKYSKTIHNAGDILELSPTRLVEINSTGHGVLVEQIDVGATLTDPPEDSPAGEEPPTDPPEDEKDKDKPPKNKKK